MNFHALKDIRAEADIRDESEPFVLSQYSASPIMNRLIKEFRKAFSIEGGAEEFFRNVFDIDTALGFGLDVWGAILGIGRDAAGIRFEDDAYRRLLKYKAAANIASSDAATLNRLINVLMGRGPCYVTEPAETGPMTLRWVFEFFMTPEERSVFEAAGSLCRGAGVGAETYETEPSRVFGFEGSGFQPFDYGSFDPAGVRRL